MNRNFGAGKYFENAIKSGQKLQKMGPKTYWTLLSSSPNGAHLGTHCRDLEDILSSFMHIV